MLGAVRLLVRRRLAALALLLAFLAIVVTFTHNFVLSDGLEVMGGAGAAFSVLILVYARAMWWRGVLP